MAKYMCTQRCYDSSRNVTYYEDTLYDLGKGDLEHLKKIGHVKRFEATAEPAAEKPKEPEEDSPEVPGAKGKRAGREKE